ncbi:MAG: hypothetical protein GF405_11105 [Candidatus Eisenbacteria bacterium]|nr:hypothetical protein [Candidatus Eisenbacteria bacterium]
MMQAPLVALAALSLTTLPASMPDQVPELLHRVVLPVTPSTPTSVDVSSRPVGEPDHLLVGLDDGTIDVFYASGSEMIVRVFELGSADPVDAVRAVRLPGPRNESAIVALQGRVLSVFQGGTPGVRDRMRLPASSGDYRLTRVRGPDVDGETRDRLLASDGRRVLEVGVGTAANRWGLSLSLVAEDEDGLALRPLSDRAVLVTASSGVLEFSVAEGMTRTAASGSADAAVSPGGTRPAIVPLGAATSDSLLCSGRRASGEWRRMVVELPDSLTLAMTVRDSMLLLGGALTADTLRGVGWLALVDAKGKGLAFSEHGRPVAAAATFGEWFAVQGEGRNLSVYDDRLRPVWDNASQVSPIGMAALALDEDGDEDLILVGTREFGVAADDVELIRESLNRPGFMASAVPVGSELVLERPMLTGFRSNAAELREIIAMESLRARELERSRSFLEAGRRVLTARAAAAVLGRRGQAEELRAWGAELLAAPKRERATLYGTIALLLPGLVWSAALVRSAERASTRAPIAAAVALVAAGAVVWGILDHTIWSPALPAGGVVLLATAAVQGARRRAGVLTARVPGAAIEELEIGIAEFTHGGADGSEGRRSIAKLALFAQEMLESFDEPEHFEALRSRLDVRAKAFYPAKYDTVQELPEHARAAGVAVTETEAMARAAGRMRAAVDVVLSGEDVSDGDLRRALHDIVAGRAELAKAADEARDAIRANPGCSVRACVTRVLDEKREMLERLGIEVDVGLGVDEQEDAVGIKRRDLHFVIENLVTNAAKAMREGSTRRIELSGVAAQPFFELRVADTGPGIPKLILESLFDTGETDGESGGFGLPNSREKLRRVGGDITVEWTGEGEGTRFLVRVPLWSAKREGGIE